MWHGDSFWGRVGEELVSSPAPATTEPFGTTGGGKLRPYTLGLRAGAQAEVAAGEAAEGAPGLAGAWPPGAGPVERVADAPGAPSPLPLGLDDAVERAVSRNEDVLIAEAEEAGTEGLVREVSAGALPELRAGGVYTRNIERPVFFFNSPEGLQRIEVGSDNEVDLSATLTQALWDPSLGPAIRAAHLTRGAAAAGTERARTAVALAARLAYFDALLARDLVRVREEAVEQARARLEQVQAFHDAGTAPDFDLLTAEVELANLRPPLIEARNGLDLALNRLKRVVGLPLEREVELTDGFLEPEAEGTGPRGREAGGGTEAEGDPDSPDLRAAWARASRGRSDLARQRFLVELREEDVEAERRSFLPSLDLTADYLHRASTDDFPGGDDFVDSLAAGLVVSVDLFDGGERRGRVAQARAALEQERQRLARLEEEVRLEVEQADLALQAARESVEASRGTVALAERALEIAQIRFRNGLSTQVELDDAELAVTEARTNLARALHAYSTARAGLQAALGER
ncbi:MAG: TolC family protein [Thermoanaerobaculia bacterium]